MKGNQLLQLNQDGYDLKRQSLPHCFADFRNFHVEETIIVCGCGASLNDLKNPEQFITIGVNDVGRLFDPTYLVVLNPRQQFKGDRFRYVETSRAKAIFTQLDLGINHPNIVRFKLGKRGGTDLSDPDTLPYTHNSPYVALCLAAYMGAKHIGLIGVDFTDNHFFGNTGRHVLNGKLASIDQEYRDLEKGLSNAGIKVFNLSQQSNITAFEKMGIEDFYKLAGNDNSVQSQTLSKGLKIFFVNYKFLSCGDVFKNGLNHAAADLGVASAEAYWDDPKLPDKVRQFEPDLIFVVHGRKFARKWGQRFQNYNTAVWLLDEPYEVDDTAQWSSYFDAVFVNDPNTIHRHHNAHYLPVCYDPHIYQVVPGPKKYDVGFIGGYNSVRQIYLEKLLQKGLLSYIIGGPWKRNLQKICLSKNIPATQTAEYYQQTRIIVNVFREVHHFNKQGISAFSLNPRVYEALACGALVVTQVREEIKYLFPEMPIFENADQLAEIVYDLLHDTSKYEALRMDCRQRIHGHTYLNRLKKVIILTLQDISKRYKLKACDKQNSNAKDDISFKEKSMNIYNHWEDYGNLVKINRDYIILKKVADEGPGTERGLVSTYCYSDIDLSFEVNIKPDACFIAKFHQVDKFDQMTDSYHLMCNGSNDYFARHNHVFKTVMVDRNFWVKLRVVSKQNDISFYRNDGLLFSIKDQKLQKGYAFLGIKSGEARLRNVIITNLDGKKLQNSHNELKEKSTYTVLHDFGAPTVPLVSIITTVYDRVACLRDCIRSVKSLTFKNYEHIIVADSPPSEVTNRLIEVVKQEGNGQIRFINLTKRYNNWGIAPASIGLKLTRGKYVCFLSDDNGYTPDHFDPLVAVLEHDSRIGFAYSSCRYADRFVLRNPKPRPGRIDLGQPLFRKELFDRYLSETLPFDMMAWDWHMIETFLKHNIKWRHIDRPSFLFRLDACRKWITT